MSARRFPRLGGLLRRRKALWAGLLPVAGLAVALEVSAPRSGCTYGCSRVEDARPLLQSCFPSTGSACYECYEASGAGFRTCYENPEGTIKDCTDYQQVPF
jgi:hypothetical protein